MILRNGSYDSLIEYVKKTSKKIVVYGAGMIGQIVVPYLIREYNLFNYVDCYVDMDARKTKNKVFVNEDHSYEVKTPDYLKKIGQSHLILISNSKFFPVIQYLDRIDNLRNVQGYIIPMMQIHELEQTEAIIIPKFCDEQLIPKKIHYCWFGGKALPESLKRCMDSWKEKCPDYEIIEWNETNYDVNKHVYTKEAYDNHKYGFVTDVARLDILYEHGGFYFDTDVMLLKNLDELLYQPGFVATEKWGNINTGGGCGFVQNHPMVEKMLAYRERFRFILDDGSYNIETNGNYETKLFIDAGFKPNNTLQVIEGVTVYPSYVNHPFDYMSCMTHMKDTTVSIHQFYGGWMEEEDRKNRENTQRQFFNILKRIEEKQRYRAL